MKAILLLSATMLLSAGCHLGHHGNHHSRHDRDGYYGGTRDYPTYERGGYHHGQRRAWQDRHGHWHYGDSPYTDEGRRWR